MTNVSEQRERILALSAEGRSAYGIARRMNLSTSTVERILNESGVETKHHCLRCKHKWSKRSSIKPEMCPKCHKRHWDVPAKKSRPVDRTQRPNPTPAEIKAACAKILEQSPRQPVGHQHVEWEPPFVSCSDANIPTGAEDGGATDRERFWT